MPRRLVVPVTMPVAVALRSSATATAVAMPVLVFTGWLGPMAAAVTRAAGTGSNHTRAESREAEEQGNGNDGATGYGDELAHVANFASKHRGGQGP